MNFVINKSIDEVSPQWDKLNGDIFLSSQYLKAKEEVLPENYKQYYISCYCGEKLIAKSVCQLIEIRLSHFSQKKIFSTKIISRLRLNIFCFGNMFLTGNHVLSGNKEGVDFFYKSIPQLVKKIEEISNKKSYLTLLKDFNSGEIEYFKNKLPKFSILKVQPNMKLDINNTWCNFQDYLSAMRTKYRTRAKRAFKKSKDIEFIEYSTSDIIKNQDKIYSLFETVVQNAEVSTYKLTVDYFIELKEKLGEDFKLYVGVMEGEMLCFCTFIINKDEVETGFLGYNKDYLIRYELYLRMLYEMIEKTILLKKKKVMFSRTALEIKSSVGAKPMDMYLLAKSDNFILNKFLLKIIGFFYKEQKWEKRNVFKK